MTVTDREKSLLDRVQEAEKKLFNYENRVRFAEESRKNISYQYTQLRKERDHWKRQSDLFRTAILNLGATCHRWKWEHEGSGAFDVLDDIGQMALDECSKYDK